MLPSVRNSTIATSSAVVVRPDLDAGRQLFLDLGQLRLDRVHDLPRVRADQHHDRAGDDLAFAVFGHGAEPQRGGYPHLAQVLDQHRRAVFVGGHHGVRDLVDAAKQPVAADRERLSVLLDVAAADRGVVLQQDTFDVGQRQAVAGQQLRVHDDLVLLGLPAHAVDLDDARDGAQLDAHHPVEQRAQLHRAVLVRHQVELVDLAQPGRHGRQLGPAVAGRDVVFGDLQPLADHLAREPDVDPLLEDHGHRRDGRAADRADLRDLGQAVHRGLDREGQVLLDLQRRQPRRAGQDRDLRVRDVGYRVDRQLPDRQQGGDEHRRPDSEDHPASSD
jgi:hypothetical protein